MTRLYACVYDDRVQKLAGFVIRDYCTHVGAHMADNEWEQVLLRKITQRLDFDAVARYLCMDPMINYYTTKVDRLGEDATSTNLFDDLDYIVMRDAHYKARYFKRAFGYFKRTLVTMYKDGVFDDVLAKIMAGMIIAMEYGGNSRDYSGLCAMLLKDNELTDDARALLLPACKDRSELNAFVTILFEIANIGAENFYFTSESWFFGNAKQVIADYYHAHK